ncbi:2,6-dioxo-6-phenylhexa-3-enoate hydrolase [Pseudonocardia sulfidoxydans NBRC 16205]|uniref:2,6-dioxo-6-phenylhexa-3-enoate hydrolase n=1 Tax=Pseudonocardia sulfidoxydans NBRC 16205 TaxID=1223511 RepID=A0A511DL32_9PSEU|nr:alpha/beta hydrolase [Pseudonocardia sulfidoxydans]GEL23758.1 2,6-dioxo-6-phenylhexa-3-enoate hydrolase [Pseudonocardia sulfidoxydans NBRC 16205]
MSASTLAAPIGLASTQMQLPSIEGPVTVHHSGSVDSAPVVFLHGAAPGAGGLSNWRPALTELGSDFFCLAPDFVGFADSWHPAEPPRDMRLWNRLRVEQTLAVLDHLGIERAHLVGSSMGASVALQLLTEAPERFDKAVLLATAGTPVPVTEELERVMSFYLDPSPAALARLYSWFVHDPAAMPVDLRALAERNYVVASRPDVRRSFEAQFASGPPVGVPETALRRISHPTLVVHGLQDSVVPVEAAYYLARHIPDVRLHVLGRCGHWIPSEYPDRTHRLLRSFFAGDL